MGHSKRSGGEVEVDLGRYELRRSGRRIKLEKKPMDLLIFLLERREQMVSRDEIVKRLWRSDLFIDTEKNVNNIVRKLRTALGDIADRPRFLETVVGKGYRFVGPVRVIDAKYPVSDSARNAARNDNRKDGSAWAERSSIAVLPLLLLEKAVDDQGLCLGFADALVSLLGNLPGVDVLPISAVLNLPLELTPSDIASRLGIRFVVHGAIQMSKGQRRLSLEMFDTYLQRPCFTKKCDIDMDRLASLQDDVAKQISRALNRSYSSVTVEQRPRYSRDPMAYAEFMRGYRISVRRCVDDGQGKPSSDHCCDSRSDVCPCSRDPLVRVHNPAFRIRPSQRVVGKGRIPLPASSRN